MANISYKLKDREKHWCPGCGNFGALNLIQQVLEEMEIPTQQVAHISGIGQAAKLPHYVNTNIFNGLHGRYLSTALAVKASNPELVVIAESGDGCTYSEGGNHFMHTIRYNPDIVNIVHNNMVYGLTKGQASPTSELGFKTKVQITGVHHEPFNPLAVAIGLRASFVARAFVGDREHTKKLYKAAIQHKGYALIDLFCPCVTFNKVNTYQWFRKNTYKLEEVDHNFQDPIAAFDRAMETDKLPLGIFYRDTSKRTYRETLPLYKKDKTPLYRREADKKKIQELLLSKT